MKKDPELFASTSSQIHILWTIMMITGQVESSQVIHVFDPLWSKSNNNLSDDLDHSAIWPPLT